MADRRADYRFVRRPAWIAGHLLAAVLLATFVVAGLWQLRRLEERRDLNATIEARAALDPEPVGELVDPDDEGDVVDGARFRAVTAAGEYLDVGTVVRANQGGVSGGRVFTVLDLGGGESVAVLRGFVGQGGGGSLTAPPPPAGAVEVAGIAFPRDRLESITRQALDDLEDEAPGLLPVVVQVGEVDDPALVAVPPPELGEGPHLAYAVQWFLFFAVGAIGYPLLLRRRAREAGGEA
jgi:cytochrome oxidase assembly protein ShyY1